MSTFAEARARGALKSAGLEALVPIERASSVTNEVWLSADHAIRVNRHPNQRLRREATLAPQLPPEVGYPEIVAYGGELGRDWLICERVPGMVLGRIWPSMNHEERREVIRQLATRMQAIHAFEVPDDVPWIDTPQLLGGQHCFSPVDPLIEGLERLSDLEFVEPRLAREAQTVVRRTAFALDPWETRTLVHGDLTFENILWDGSTISAVLDFEWARRGPADLDLDVFLRFCAYPFLHVAEDYEDLTLTEDYADVPWWLAEDYPALFDFRHQYERMRLYAIAYDVRELLRYPPSDRPSNLSTHHPYNRLERVVGGQSYLDQLKDPEGSASSY